MDRVGMRELRNYASRVVRRAQAGQRIVITVDGVPAAQMAPQRWSRGANAGRSHHRGPPAATEQDCTAIQTYAGTLAGYYEHPDPSRSP